MSVSAVAVWLLNIVLSDPFVLMVGMFGIVGVTEYFFPAQKIPRRHYALNLRYAFVNVLLIGAITPFVSAATAYAIQKLGFGFIDLRALGFGGMSGALFAVLVGALILDFFQYWEHRLLHASPLFWQMHVLHHSDEHMNMTTESRHHLLEFLMAPIFVTIPAAIVFQAPPVDIALMSLIPYAWGYLAHANINLGFGPLWWLLVSPDYHRVHHSLLPEHIDKNFVIWFPVWDIIFGTAVNPRWRECPPTGFADVSVHNVRQAYLLPFVGWMRMISRQGHDAFVPSRTERTLPRA